MPGGGDVDPQDTEAKIVEAAKAFVKFPDLHLQPWFADPVSKETKGKLYLSIIEELCLIWDEEVSVERGKPTKENLLALELYLYLSKVCENVLPIATPAVGPTASRKDEIKQQRKKTWDLVRELSPDVVGSWSSNQLAVRIQQIMRYVRILVVQLGIALDKRPQLSTTDDDLFAHALRSPSFQSVLSMWAGKHTDLLAAAAGPSSSAAAPPPADPPAAGPSSSGGGGDLFNDDDEDLLQDPDAEIENARSLSVDKNGALKSWVMKEPGKTIWKVFVLLLAKLDNDRSDPIVGATALYGYLVRVMNSYTGTVERINAFTESQTVQFTNADGEMKRLITSFLPDSISKLSRREIRGLIIDIYALVEKHTWIWTPGYPQPKKLPGNPGEFAAAAVSNEFKRLISSLIAGPPPPAKEPVGKDPVLGGGPAPAAAPAAAPPPAEIPSDEQRNKWMSALDELENLRPTPQSPNVLGRVVTPLRIIIKDLPTTGTLLLYLRYMKRCMPWIPALRARQQFLYDLLQPNRDQDALVNGTIDDLTIYGRLAGAESAKFKTLVSAQTETIRQIVAFIDTILYDKDDEYQRKLDLLKSQVLANTVDAGMITPAIRVGSMHPPTRSNEEIEGIINKMKLFLGDVVDPIIQEIRTSIDKDQQRRVDYFGFVTCEYFRYQTVLDATIPLAEAILQVWERFPTERFEDILTVKYKVPAPTAEDIVHQIQVLIRPMDLHEYSSAFLQYRKNTTKEMITRLQSLTGGKPGKGPTGKPAAKPKGELPMLPAKPKGELPMLPAKPKGEFPKLPAKPKGKFPKLPAKSKEIIIRTIRKRIPILAIKSFKRATVDSKKKTAKEQEKEKSGGVSGVPIDVPMGHAKSQSLMVTEDGKFQLLNPAVPPTALIHDGISQVLSAMFTPNVDDEPFNEARASEIRLQCINMRTLLFSGELFKSSKEDEEEVAEKARALAWCTPAIAVAAKLLQQSHDVCRSWTANNAKYQAECQAYSKAMEAVKKLQEKCCQRPPPRDIDRLRADLGRMSGRLVPPRDTRYDLHDFMPLGYYVITGITKGDKKHVLSKKPEIENIVALLIFVRFMLERGLLEEDLAVGAGVRHGWIRSASFPRWLKFVCSLLYIGEDEEEEEEEEGFVGGDGWASSSSARPAYSDLPPRMHFPIYQPVWFPSLSDHEQLASVYWPVGVQA